MGECYVRGDGKEGAGGSIITPTGGVGGFGYVPLQPQNHTGYDEDPCSGGSELAEYTVTWKAGSAQCKNRGEAGTCTTLYQGHHTSLDEAKERCEYANGVHLGSGVQSCGPCRWVNGANGDPVEKCKQRCERINKNCIDDCPRGDKNCMYECNLELRDCLRDCER
jgi:hypothetical protein